jgi:hypothetical protein
VFRNLVRSTPGTTLTSLGTGRYDVTFPSSVAGCAYLARVGDPGNALVYNPNGVYTGSASNPDAVYIETKNTAGGLSSGIPFHLAVRYTPGTVEIAPGTGATTIGIQVRDLLYFCGNLDNLSFHAAAVC